MTFKGNAAHQTGHLSLEGIGIGAEGFELVILSVLKEPRKLLT